VVEAPRHLAGVLGGALLEVLEAALGVVGELVDVGEVRLGADDAHRRPPLGERASAADRGDEQAFTGVKEDREHGDDAVRPPFPDRPADLVPYGRPTYRLHQELIGLRRRHSWLHRARTRKIELTNQRYVYEASDGDHRLLVRLDLSTDPHSYRIDEHA